MKSIRTFLTIVIMSSITLMVFLNTLNGYQDSVDKAEQLFDTELVDKAHLLLVAFSSIRNNDNNGLYVTQKEPMNLLSNKFFAFQVWQNKNLLLSSPNADTKAIGQFNDGFQKNNFLGHRWRVYAQYNQAADLWIFTSERMDIRYMISENIILQSIFPVVIMLPVLALIVWFIISFGLRPLKNLSHALSTKRADDLSTLSISKQPIELIQVVSSINDLFARLREAFLREKRFASDAAHELRTPISAIKIHLHNLAHQLPENEPSFIQLNASVKRMGHLVEQILNLNRTTLEQYTNKFASIDLYVLAQNVIANNYQQFEQKNIQIELKSMSQNETCCIMGDMHTLEILLNNLLSNACKYIPDNAFVWISIFCDKETQTPIIQIMDSGPGVSEDKYQRLFDRFYRLDGDRHASGTSGCGLGLAIVKQIADLHQAAIHFSATDYSQLVINQNTNTTMGKGLSIKIVFPKEHKK